MSQQGRTDHRTIQSTGKRRHLYASVRDLEAADFGIHGAAPDFAGRETDAEFVEHCSFHHSMSFLSFHVEAVMYF